MPLFDDIQRTQCEPADLTEDTFSFLNRSASSEYESVREVLEGFFSRYPSTERTELKSKCRSQFDTAFFELFIHELLLRLGCQVTVHPILDGTTSTPDFLARFPSGEEVILEAVIATDLSDEERASNARLDALYDTINRNVNSPNFFLCLGPIHNQDAVPPPEKIWKFIKTKIADLNPDLVTEGIENRRANALPQWTYRHANGFELEFCAIPKSPGTRDKPAIRPIGAFPGRARWGGSSSALKKAIKGKATKYGTLNKPFVVVVNAISKWGTGRDDEVEALFGSQESNAKPDAVWNHTKNTRLSGVLITKVSPWSIHCAPLCLYHNPFAKRPCLDFPWEIPQSIRQDSQMHWLEGRKPTELFHLPENWLAGRICS